MISEKLPLLLGSQSPRRKDILESLRIPFTVLPADVIEDEEPGETPEVYLARIVLSKLAAVAERARASGRECSAILVADTTVVLGSSILGKPRDVAHAEELLRALCGHTHQVFTRYAIASVAPFSAPSRVRSVRTAVRLKAASPAEIRRYAESGEGLDKAGAYAAQGLGSFLVESVEGSYTNVVGLPAAEVVTDLTELRLLTNYP
jgi:septum formation protein